MKIFIITLLTSAVFHLLVITILIIDFPSTNESFKPHYIFLGSILNKDDFNGSSLKNKQKVSVVYAADLLSEGISQPINTIKTIEVSKPGYTPVRTSKNTLKSTFLTEQEELINTAPVTETEENILLPAPAYKPLRLKNL